MNHNLLNQLYHIFLLYSTLPQITTHQETRKSGSCTENKLLLIRLAVSCSSCICRWQQGRFFPTALLQEALAALKKRYQEFGVAFTYGEQAKDPQDHEKLVEIIDAFGPMPCRMIFLTTQRMARMIEDAIAGDFT